ncbi:protein D2-like [Uloborus diversus]|uniref:protein D2-like n=1 Tax=Uloborus diversus TaxID=327109 RepID=UPI002409CCDF|nr:protein D2-like [Uloborus diversus]
MMLASAVQIFIVCFYGIAFCYGQTCDLSKFTEDQIVPHIIPKTPDEALKVSYAGVEVECGTELPRDRADPQPQIEYTAINHEFYTLVMIDPDAPDPDTPNFRHFLHWFVVNIPGSAVSQGKVLTQYMMPSPPAYSRAHRYIFLVYKQPIYIFSPSYMDGKRRSKFDLEKMVQELELVGPLSGNYFFTKHERSKK